MTSLILDKFTLGQTAALFFSSSVNSDGSFLISPQSRRILFTSSLIEIGNSKLTISGISEIAGASLTYNYLFGGTLDISRNSLIEIPSFASVPLADSITIIISSLGRSNASLTVGRNNGIYTFDLLRSEFNNVDFRRIFMIQFNFNITVKPFVFFQEFDPIVIAPRHAGGSGFIENTCGY